MKYTWSQIFYSLMIISLHMKEPVSLQHQQRQHWKTETSNPQNINKFTKCHSHPSGSAWCSGPLPRNLEHSNSIFFWAKCSKSNLSSLVVLYQYHYCGQNNLRNIYNFAHILHLLRASHSCIHCNSGFELHWTARAAQKVLALQHRFDKKKGTWWWTSVSYLKHVKSLGDKNIISNSIPLYIYYCK